VFICFTILDQGAVLVNHEGGLLVVVVFLCLNHKHRDAVVVDVVDDAVVGVM